MSPCAIWRTKVRGQSVVLAAIILPFLAAFLLLVVEVSERWLEVAMVEDALQQTTRSMVQRLDYAALARGQASLVTATDCQSVRWDADPACQPLLAQARQLLITNLSGVRGLVESPTATADRVTWTVLARGGTCIYSSTAVTPVTATTPLLCAEVRPVMRGLVGWGEYTPLVVAADTLDPVTPLAP